MDTPVEADAIPGNAQLEEVVVVLQPQQPSAVIDHPAVTDVQVMHAATSESPQPPPVEVVLLAQPPQAVVQAEELNRHVSGELVLRVPAPVKTRSPRQTPPQPPPREIAPKSKAPMHSASLCTNLKCSECSDFISMIDSVDPDGQLGDITRSIVTSRNESNFYSYVAIGSIRAFSKISLVKLFEALDGPMVPHRSILDAAIGYLQDTYTSLIKGDIAALISTANEVLENFYKQPSAPITTEIICRVFPILMVPSKRGEGIKSSTIIQRLADAARGSAIKSVFAKNVLMHLTRCVEQRLIFVGNLIIGMFDTINIMIDLIHPHYVKRITEDYGVVTSVGGLTVEQFIVSSMTAQLITNTQTFFEYVFDRRNDVEVQCTADSVRILKSEELGKSLSDTLKTMKDSPNNSTPSSSSSTQPDTQKKRSWLWGN